MAVSSIPASICHELARRILQEEIIAHHVRPSMLLYEVNQASDLFATAKVHIQGNSTHDTVVVSPVEEVESVSTVLCDSKAAVSQTLASLLTGPPTNECFRAILVISSGELPPIDNSVMIFGEDDVERYMHDATANQALLKVVSHFSIDLDQPFETTFMSHCTFISELAWHLLTHKNSPGVADVGKQQLRIALFSRR